MADASDGSRELILKRVRAAVKDVAPRRPETATGPIFPRIAAPLERFQAECAANCTEVVLTESSVATSAALKQVLASLPAGEVFAQDASELRGLLATSAEDHSIRWSSQGAPLESSQATVTLCEALVAMTGSVLVSSSCGGRGASVVAPCHIVVAHTEQLVHDLDAALERASRIAFDNSYVGLISGCSRTADIEKLLVRGAHGPRRVVVILQQRVRFELERPLAVMT